MNVFDLFAKITLDSKDYEEQLGEAGSKTSGFADKLKSGLATAGKVAGAGLAAATTAIVALGKASIEGYAEYEQLIGGVETLYGSESMSIEEYAKSVGKSVDEVSHQYEMLMNRQDAVMENAQNAYKTAGMSANEYMNTVNGFAASLTSSLGEYEWQAAGYADMIVTDMADNANKMGTSFESIQNAYSGFAKQNYTMLDNLKLGYGGTKEEMERLLRDAEKYAGYIEGSLSIESFADVAEAINIVQTELGITGTTAKEASGTISGSIATMKSAWANFITGMADPSQDFGALLGNLVDSVVTVGKNIVPRIQELLPRLTEGLTQLVSSLLPYIPETLNSMLPTLIEGAASLINGAMEVLPEIINTAVSAIPQLLEAGMSIISNLVNALFEALPMVVEAGTNILLNLVSGIAEGLPELMTSATDMIMKIVETLTNPETLTNMLDAALEILIALAEGLEDAIPQLVDAALTIVERLVGFISDPKNIAKILNAALKIVISLGEGIIKAIPRLIKSVSTLVSDVRSKITDTDWAEVGKNVVDGVWEGLKKTWNDLVEWFEDCWDDLVDDVKNLLGIHSPSRVFASIGGYMAEGLGDGWSKNFDKVKGKIEDGMDFGTASIDFASSGMGKNVFAVSGSASANNERPIMITVQSVLDGKVIGETAYRYGKNKGRMYGTA